MRHDCFALPNTTQLGSKQPTSGRIAPSFPGDSRITAVYVGDLLEEQKIAKPKMEAFLDQEAAILYAHVPGTARPYSTDYGSLW